MVQLDELRSILLSERETGRLVQVHSDLFTSAMKEVGALRKEVESEDPFSDRSQMKIERVNSIRETIQDLFRIRAEKILWSKAWSEVVRGIFQFKVGQRSGTVPVGENHENED